MLGLRTPATFPRTGSGKGTLITPKLFLGGAFQQRPAIPEQMKVYTYPEAPRGSCCTPSSFSFPPPVVLTRSSGGRDIQSHFTSFPTLFPVRFLEPSTTRASSAGKISDTGSQAVEECLEPHLPHLFHHSVQGGPRKDRAWLKARMGSVYCARLALGCSVRMDLTETHRTSVRMGTSGLQRKLWGLSSGPLGSSSSSHLLKALNPASARGEEPQN